MGPRVVVVGSVNEDLVLRVPRLPRPGETVLGGPAIRGMGGKGANAALAAARLGARTWLVGAVGDDDAARRARAVLSAGGVDIDHLDVSAEPTGTAQILVDDAGENVIAVAPGANACLAADRVRSALESVLDHGGVVLTNHEIPEAAVQAAAESARAAGALFVLDPAPARPVSPGLLRWCDVVTPNEHELRALVPPDGRSTQSDAEAAAALVAMGAPAVIVTRGADGADLYRPDRAPHHQPAFAAAAIDATGAGDAFSAGLAWSLASGYPLEDAVRHAAAAGACATERVGAQASLPDRDELERRLRGAEAE